MQPLDTPAAIEFLFHCYVKVTPFANQDALYYRRLIAVLLSERIIYRESPVGSNWPNGQQVYRVTSLGKAWVTAICNTEKPILKTVYIDMRGKILSEEI